MRLRLVDPCHDRLDNDTVVHGCQRIRLGNNLHQPLLDHLFALIRRHHLLERRRPLLLQCGVITLRLVDPCHDRLDTDTVVHGCQRIRLGNNLHQPLPDHLFALIRLHHLLESRRPLLLQCGILSSRRRHLNFFLRIFQHINTPFQLFNTFFRLCELRLCHLCSAISRSQVVYDMRCSLLECRLLLLQRHDLLSLEMNHLAHASVVRYRTLRYPSLH